MRKIVLALFLLALLLSYASVAIASDTFSSPAAALNYSQFGNLNASIDPGALVNLVQTNSATTALYKSYGCSTGCSYGCSNGCSVGCSVGCKNPY